MENNIVKRTQMFLQRLRYPFIKQRFLSLNVATIEQTIDKIINDKASIARFGDGELRWLLNINLNSFQKGSPVLSQRLAEVLQSAPDPDILIGLPDSFRGTDQLKTKAKHFWEYFTVRYSHALMPYLSSNRIYYNANITRNYIDYLDGQLAAARFEKVKQIWQNRKILLVEGAESRIGVGNDLFNEASSVRRILCPPTNAFEYYNEIKQSITANVSDGELILLSLGPTATILAYDIHKQGKQIIDFGQIDVEYEWFLQGAKVKKPIAGKYVNEVYDQGGREVENIHDSDYLNEIIKVIK